MFWQHCSTGLVNVFNLKNMASIDKTYCNKEEYIQARKFWIDTYDEQVRLFGEAQWLYPFNVYGNKEITPEFLNENTEDIDNHFGTLWNTSTLFDMWLAKKCDIPFIQKRLHDQYNETWYVWEVDLKFDVRPVLLKVSQNDSCIDLFKDINNEEVEPLEKMIVFGTTYLLKVFNKVKNNIAFGGCSKDNIVSYYYVFGIIIKNVDGVTYIEKEGGDEEIDIGYFDIPFPEIKYSLNGNDVKGYDLEEIYFSEDGSFYAFTDYKECSFELLNRALFLLPNYLEDFIIFRNGSKA